MTAEIPDAIRRAMEAQARRTGKIDVAKVEAALEAGNPIPPDADAVAEERGDWRELMKPAPEQELSEAELAMIQPSLLDERVTESTPKARASDPPTSHDAADAVRITAESSKAKLLLAHYDDLERGERFGMTDEQACVAAGLPLQSEYATRCSELRKVEPPLLAETGEERIGSAGVERMVSAITAEGVRYVREHGWRVA